jgi:hypothetical protein
MDFVKTQNMAPEDFLGGIDEFVQQIEALDGVVTYGVEPYTLLDTQEELMGCIRQGKVVYLSVNFTSTKKWAGSHTHSLASLYLHPVDTGDEEKSRALVGVMMPKEIVKAWERFPQVEYAQLEQALLDFGN